MIIDVVYVSGDTTKVLESYPGLVRFKKLHPNWFNVNSKVYIRQVGKKHKGKWRIIPNRFYEFYRCNVITSPDLINDLNFKFVAQGV